VKASSGLPQSPNSVSPRAKLWLARLEAVAILLASFALAAYVVARKKAVAALLASLGVFAIPLAVAIFAVVASAPFSVTDALAVMNGVLFGPLWGSIVNALGIVLAAIIGYLVALRTSKLLDLDAQLKRLPAWARRFKPGSPMFLITVRIIPGLGGTIATQTAAALRVPIFRQIYTMSAIAIPICTALAIGGDALSNYVSDHIYAPTRAFAERHHIRLPHRPKGIRLHIFSRPTPEPRIHP
jgi:uncharacterized membrane protein YdjX (TVP38/TMEM64 family)